MTGVLCAVAGSGMANPITLNDTEIYSSGTGTQTASLTIANDGMARQSITLTGSSDLAAWLASWATPADYEVYATATSGAVATGTIGAWQDLGTSRSWSATDPTANGISNEAVLSVSIRKIGVPITLDTATFTLTAERF